MSVAALSEWAPELAQFVVDEGKMPKDLVGPVFMKSELAVYATLAIAEDNPETFVGILDRGLYIRVLGQRRLVLNKATLERVAGREVRFPGEVEVIMSAFAGKIQVTGEKITWYLEL
jgi:toluene monooxygenase system protein D